MDRIIKAEDKKVVDDAIHKLAERFDTVCIMVTSHDGSRDRAEGCVRFCGNYFAVYGQICDWLNAQELSQCAGEDYTDED